MPYSYYFCLLLGAGSEVLSQLRSSEDISCSAYSVCTGCGHGGHDMAMVVIVMMVVMSDDDDDDDGSDLIDSCEVQAGRSQCFCCQYSEWRG